MRFECADGAVTVVHGRPLPGDLLVDLLAAKGEEFVRGVTTEGEHAIRFTHLGLRRAWVLGDRCMSTIEASTDAPTCRDLVDAIAPCFPLRLGWQRARRFEVVVPPGWRAFARDLTVCLDAQAGNARITIPAAVPLGSDTLAQKFL